MKKFEFFEHTADAKFRAYGKNIEEQFSNAALAMFSIMTDTKDIKPQITKKISAEGNDEKAILYNFLEDFLILLDTDAFLLNKIEKIKIEKKSAAKFNLTATAVGDTASDEYELKGEVKAVTYNEMEVNDEFVQVVVDI